MVVRTVRLEIVEPGTRACGGGLDASDKSNKGCFVLIFGFSVSESLLATTILVCERCGVQAAHRLVKRVRKFSLFFIPLFPVGTRYLDTCTNCGRVVGVPAQQAEAAARRTGQ